MALSSTKYASVSGRVSLIATQLRALGVSSEIQLPTLVIGGNQSSGKSSVVEAIAGIPLPRSKGTCTRCPTEVRLRIGRSDLTKVWSCRVLLKREYDSNDRKLAEIPPEELFTSICDKKDITVCVLAAQAVLLNPDTVEEEGGCSRFAPTGKPSFLEGTQICKALEAKIAIGDSELEFTSNSIVLEIEGAEADLTIVDLPGVIQSHAKGRHHIEVITSMVKKYIGQGHVVITKTLTAMDDPENQAINQFATEADPEGDRTIGIITKPDNIPSGEEDKWLSVANNKTQGQYLKLGWFVVKNPDQTQLDSGISFEDSRLAENAWFVASPFWSKVDDPERLGVSNLRSKLSEELINRIIVALPKMKALAENQLKVTCSKLDAMPRPLGGDLEYELQTILRDLVSYLDGQISGRGSDTDLSVYKQLATMFRAFEADLIANLPSFDVSGKVVRAMLSERLVDVQEASTPVTLQYVKDLRSSYLGRELPGFSPYLVVEKLIAKFQGQWADAMLDLMQKVKSMIQSLVDKRVKESFAQFPTMRLTVSSILESYLDEAAEVCVDRLKILLEMEAMNIYTQNDHYYLESHKKFLTDLKIAVLAGESQVWAPLDEATQNKTIGKLAMMGIKVKNLWELYLSQPTPVDDELDIMAACLAYYKVVFKRVIDEVPMHVRRYLMSDFLRSSGSSDPLPKRVHQSIMSMFDKGADKHQGLLDLFAEDSSVDHKRRQLQDTRNRLTAALKVLRDPLKEEVPPMVPPMVPPESSSTLLTKESSDHKAVKPRSRTQSRYTPR